jgi:MYXO-CTERM domain-containing protein
MMTTSASSGANYVVDYTAGGPPTGGIDNVRGLTLIGNEIFMCNDGTGNGAPGPSVFRFDTAGNQLGFFLTPSATGPFDVLSYGNNMLVSSDAANDDIHQYTLGGASAGTFHNSASLNFAEQMDYDPTGNILVAGFSSNIVATLNFNTGAIMSTFAASGARGVKQLGNGNIMWTSGAGAFVYDIGTQQSTLMYQGGGRFIGLVSVPAPGALAMAGLAGLVVRRRRRRR